MMRFGEVATVAEIAAAVGEPIVVVVAEAEVRSLPGLDAGSLLTQAQAERLASVIEERQRAAGSEGDV